MSTSSDKNKQVSTKCGGEFLKSLKDCPWKSFDEMIKSLTTYNLVKLNRDVWESGICSCYYWLKNRKCYHVVATAYRVKLCNFNEICFDQVIEPNRRRGAPEKNKPALMMQPSEVNKRKKDLLVEDDDDDDEPITNLAKRVMTQRVTNIQDLIAVEAATEPSSSTPQPNLEQSVDGSIDVLKCKICGETKIKKSRYASCPNKCKPNKVGKKIKFDKY